ncbi:MAG TPA: polyprenyl synthetase family protein [Burkholderiales bacterium]|nr:polyprenyl synthetase family protein [Betaproteobacteria bacterium]HQR53738.1 polyprenyl synthetase family protein [Burkholderiales bacterium]
MENLLARLLPSAQVAPVRLHEAMRYAVLGGGKRVRPLLALAAGEVAEAPAERVAVVGAAVELIHAYSLVHDDLPCMDDDVLRRGKPTCHVEFDEATALLVGDALQSLAFDLMSARALAPDPRTQLEMVALLATAAGSRGMAGGQAIDLDAVGKSLTLPELEFMHIHKTGALIRAAVVLGARCGAALDGDGLARLDRFAKYIGLAFQVVDDVLDADSNTATLGKTAGKDADHDKPTYVQLLGIAGARQLALEMRGTALEALAPFGARARRLAELADFIVMRKF